MKSNRIMRVFHRLDPSMKFLFFGLIIGIAAPFMTWTDTTIRDISGVSAETIDPKNGFDSFSVVAILSIIFIAFSLISFVQHFFANRSTFGIKHHSIWFFCGAQGIFMLFISYFLFNALRKNIEKNSYFEEDSLRYGFLLMFFSFVLILFAGYLAYREEQRREVIKSFAPGNLDKFKMKPESPGISSKQLSFADKYERS